MRVYHLTSEKWALEAIKLRRLKVSRFSDLNDPFELLGLELNTKEDRKAFNKLKDEVNDLVGPLCFSKKWKNPVLWSHYGDKHKGICLGFDILDDWAYEIDYVGERLKEDIEGHVSEMLEETFGHKLLTTKYEHWQYEEEVRMIVNLKDMEHEKGLYFLPFCEGLKLKEVIVGPRCELALHSIKSKLSKSDVNVKLTKSRLAFKSASSEKFVGGFWNR
jgi:hypothetical protein